jgi:polar amino acid transport system permease protein
MFDNFFERLTETLKDYDKTLLAGLKNTLLIAVLALVIGIIIGTLIASIKVMPKKKKSLLGFLELIGNGYVAIFRGTPLVVQLLLLYFGLLAPLRLPAVIIAIIIFGLNSGAYVSEIMRAGIMAVDKGQTEAGRSLGLNYELTMKKVVLPQAVKNIIPTLGNELVALLKETSVAGFITVVDVTKATQHIVAANYDAVVPYIILAVIYLIVVGIATFFKQLLRGG